MIGGQMPPPPSMMMGGPPPTQQTQQGQGVDGMLADRMQQGMNLGGMRQQGPQGGYNPPPQQGMGGSYPPPQQGLPPQMSNGPMSYQPPPPQVNGNGMNGFQSHPHPPQPQQQQQQQQYPPKQVPPPMGMGPAVGQPPLPPMQGVPPPMGGGPPHQQQVGPPPPLGGGTAPPVPGGMPPQQQRGPSPGINPMAPPPPITGQPQPQQTPAGGQPRYPMYPQPPQQQPQQPGMGGPGPMPPLPGQQYPPPQQMKGYPPTPQAPQSMANGPAMPPQSQQPFNQFQPPQQINGYHSQTPQPAYPGAPPGGMRPGQPMGMGPGAPPQQPGQYPSYPQPGVGMSGQPAYAQPSQQAPKRLDPDQMPSAIQVMQEDQQTRAGLFVTNQKGLLPPLVTTKFQVDDQGNASPRYLRSTMYSVPALPDMLKQTAIPFALIINGFESPAKDEQPPACVDLGPVGPVRCIRCKAYMSPLMQFIDGGRRFQCLLCKATTEVPPEYFQHLDHMGQRLDKYERPELSRGTYEFVATAEYCRNNKLPKEPAYIFVIDVSYNNVKSGLVNLLCSQIKNLLECLPSHTPVGFITYNSKVHFYNIDPSLAQPQMVIVPDVADMFMPLLTGFLVPREEASATVDALMEQIPVMFGDTKETDAVLSSAIVAGMEALKASERAGKLLTFHSSLPVSDAVPNAKLRNREADRKLLGTEKEKVVLTPQSPYYSNLGQECVAAGVSVDLYLFNNSYVDVATIGQVARITGGSVNKYTYFQADIDGPRVIGDLQCHLSRPVAFDAVMRVRTSTGVRPVDFFGHYYMSNTTDVELAAIDSQKSIAVEIKHDDKLTDEDGVYIQVALLYTSIFGQRRLRIHNIALSTCTQMADLYRNCELDCIINFLAKQGISKSVDSTPVAIKESLINRCALMLATYRKHCANPSMPGQLILPECLKLLPLYANCILHSDAVAGTAELTPDDRSWLMYTMMTMGVNLSVHYFYPKLFPIAGPGMTLDNPTPVRCSRDKMSDEYAFILENGIYIFLWIGSAVSGEWLQDIFGVSNLAQINVEIITELPDHVNTDESLRLRALIRSLRNERQRHMRLTIVRQRDKMEMVMNKFLAEDRGSEGQPSYVDFLCHMHKEIRALLNQ